jgi:hypothetical protein
MIDEPTLMEMGQEEPEFVFILPIHEWVIIQSADPYTVARKVRFVRHPEQQTPRFHADARWDRILHLLDVELHKRRQLHTTLGRITSYAA